MNRLFAILWAMLILVPGNSIAQEFSKLPPPDTTGGLPLMQALKERKSVRSFADKPIPQQTLSNLLWAAFGINRPDGRRTAPSAMNWQEIDITSPRKRDPITSVATSVYKLLHRCIAGSCRELNLLGGCPCST